MPANKVQDQLLDLNTALEEISEQEFSNLYKEYVNPGLGSLKGLLGFDKIFVRAEGTRLWDRNGQEYLDFLGGYGALNFGHNPTRIQQMVQDVLERPNMLQTALNPLECIAAYNLAQITPPGLSRTFFCNSGSEAVEGALKTARAATGKQIIISCIDSYHGMTIGATTLSGKDQYREPFKPLLSDCHLVPFGDLKALEQQILNEDVAAVILEPIQGEGGMIIPKDSYLRQVRQLCSDYEALMIVDEVQTGMGRTGRYFAVDREEVIPDIICLAKSLGGGVMPVGAFHTTEQVWNQAYGGVEKSTYNTSTFGGNTLAMAAVIGAIQELVEQRWDLEAEKKGNYLLNGLHNLQEKYSVIKEVRGVGLMVGIELQPEHGFWNVLTGGKANQLTKEYSGALVVGELFNKFQIITGFTRNKPNVIRLEPALTVSYDEIDRVLNRLDDLFQKKGSLLELALSTTGTVLKSLFKG